MTVETLDIVFTNGNDDTFKTGEVIRGEVKVCIRRGSLKYRGIKVAFKGEAKVYWTESKSDGGSDSYRGEETYLHHKYYINGEGKEAHLLQPGSYSFPFSYQLPSGIPSSFEGSYGQVRYQVAVKVDRPMRVDNTCTKYFRVINEEIHWNETPDARLPVIDTAEKHFCCFCCKSGPLSAKISIPQGYFVPGDKINVSVEVDNKSSKAISSSRVELKQCTENHATFKTKKHEDVLVRLDLAGVEPGDSETFSNCYISVPSVVPSGFPCCSIIDVSYTLKLFVVPSGFGINLQASLPIKIGTVPLREDNVCSADHRFT